MVKDFENILHDLEAVSEDLLSYTDTIWQDIDHKNPTQLQSGVTFVESLHERIANLGKFTAQLEELVRQYTRSTRQQPQIIQISQLPGERKISELDRATPHYLNENFTFKRPYGFVLDQYSVTHISTWRELYRALCQVLAQRDEGVFKMLPENDKFLSPYGHREFTRNQADLREAMAIGGGLFAEANLSANGLRDNMRQLLQVFQIQESALRIYLRQDRAAASEPVA